MGARFRGTNRQGWRRWTATCTVITADPGAQFTFEVRYGPLPMSSWTYEFNPEDGSCRVRESWADRRPGWLSKIGPMMTRIRDRSQHNRETMQFTLAQLARRAEARSSET